jgi:rubredoxin
MSDPAVEIVLDRYECRACGYVYEPDKGDSKYPIEPGTPFTELPQAWRCPVCGVRTSQFENVGPSGTASGFKENLSFGLGVNKLTPAQKNLLIFGGLALGVLFFLSLYGLQ